MSIPTHDHFMLVILDGWGHGPKPAADAIAQANTPFVDSLYTQYPNAELITFGSQVGLPEGQMGNSEVGHLNIGAGRVVYQELERINKAIEHRTLHQNETLLAALKDAKERQKSIHLMGLVSDGGVHSHLNHLKALCDIIAEHQVGPVYIHAFLDGRDTDPKGGVGYLTELAQHIADKDVHLASMIGRYYAMDRDKRWERTKLAYDLLVHGKGKVVNDFGEALSTSYTEGITDEFVLPHISPNAVPLRDEDLLICFNFRTDRPRQISSVLTQQDNMEYNMHPLTLHYVTMTSYDDTFKDISILFPKTPVNNTLGALFSNLGKTQVRIAETEKYPHVTFFFSGGKEAELPKEKRILIPSPKVATYDLQPEMSAYKITEAIIAEIQSHTPNFICLNYANTDMVGHTGDFAAAIKAAETVDNCLAKLVPLALKHNYGLLIIADHGNADYMINEDGSPNTAHSLSPVPCFYLGKGAEKCTLKDGKLADVAPTILSAMGLTIPKEMDGNVLIS